MAETKRIAISLPDSLLKEFDDLIVLGNGKRSEFIREAMKYYISEKKRMDRMDRMRAGYMEMGDINLTLAEVGLTADYESIVGYESRLAECE